MTPYALAYRKKQAQDFKRSMQAAFPMCKVRVIMQGTELGVVVDYGPERQVYVSSDVASNRFRFRNPAWNLGSFIHMLVAEQSVFDAAVRAIP